MNNEPVNLANEQLLELLQSTCLSSTASIDDLIALSRRLIDAESFPTMEHLARRQVFDSEISSRFLRLLERIPTLKAVRGWAGTKHLAEVIAADADISERQAFRVIDDAIESGWIFQANHPTRNNGTDNRFCGLRKIPERFEALTRLRIAIAKAVEAQIEDPLNFEAGKPFVPEGVYFHPTQVVIEKILESHAKRKKVA